MHSSCQCYYWHDNIFFVQIGGPERQSIWSSCGRVPPPTPRLHILKTVYMVVICLSSISKWIVKLSAFVNLARLWLGQRPSEGVKLEEAGVTSISLAWGNCRHLAFSASLDCHPKSGHCSRPLTSSGSEWRSRVATESFLYKFVHFVGGLKITARVLAWILFL